MQKSDPGYEKSLVKYCDLMAAGKGSKVALQQSGLSHAQADLAWYGDTRNPKHVTFDPKFAGLAEQAQAVRIGELRTSGTSWGAIAVITGWSESKVRNHFGRFYGVASEGTRIGKGGRWLNGEQRFYTGNRKGIGVEDEKPRSLDPEKVARASENATSVLPAKVQAAKAGAKARVTRKAAVKATA